MAKPSVFIGSSSEGLPIAERIKKELEGGDFCSVKIWKEGLFQLNKSYLDSLLKSTIQFDFAILVLTPDDLTIRRHKTSKVARDNVIFELGLFVGRLGLHRAFIMSDESVKILSDFSGIEIATFRMRGGAIHAASFAKACARIRDAICRNYQQSELTLLPSTAMAVGYYMNFVKRVHEEVFVRDMPLMIYKSPIHERVSRLTIVIPRAFSDLEERNFKDTIENREMKRVTLETQTREYPFYLRGEYKAGSPLELYDIPTTLRASMKAIKLYLGKTSIGKGEDEECLERREIHNFAETLRRLIGDELGEQQKRIVVLEE